MDPPMTLNLVAVAINTLLLAVLVIMYLRIYREVPTRFTLGLMVFAAVLLVQNGIQLYFFATMMDYYVGGVQSLVLIQNGLATLALAFLVFVTWRPDASSAAPLEPAPGPHD